MGVKEKPFPRGGNKPSFHKKSSSFSLFGKLKTKAKKKSKKTNEKLGKTVRDERNDHVKAIFTPAVKFVEDLSTSGVQEGMLVLGILSQVTDKILNVSLPGSLRGVVTLANVSTFYKNLIENMTDNTEVIGLQDIFEPGDILPFKIISGPPYESCLQLTCDPKLVNSKLTHDAIEKGLVLCGNVKSKEDHGFIIDFGLENTYGFLNFKKVKSDKDLKVGQIVRCAVINCNKTPGFCNVQVSMLDQDIKSSYLALGSPFPLLYCLPGFQFEVSVVKVLKNGVEVTYGSSSGTSSKGYIHEDQLLYKFPKLENLNVGTKFIATLLYIKSLVNIPYFKVMPTKKQEWPFRYGEIVKGKVVKARRNGLIVKIMKDDKKVKCFIPVSKLKNTKKLIEGETSIENLYPVDTMLNKIRLGHVNYMGRYYLGATDKENLEEKYYSVFDLKCGEIVSGTILSFNEKGAQVLVGKTLKCFVDFMDMTDVPIKNPMSRFKIDQRIKARVLKVVPETKFVQLTMKPTLLKEKNILSSVNFNKKKAFKGVVCKVYDNKLLVRFFNGINGLVVKHFTPYPDAASLKEKFTRGELVSCYVLKVGKDGLVLSLLQSNFAGSLKVGKKYEATIMSQTEKALLLDVQINKGKNCTAYLPRELLTIHRKLAAPLLETYSVGEKVSVHCVRNDASRGLPVMGLLEIFDRFYEDVSKRDGSTLLAPGSVLPFLFKNRNIALKRNFLFNLVPNKVGCKVRVVRDDANEEGVLMNLRRNELVYGKILHLSDDRMDVSIKVADVWSKDFDVSLEFLDSYLKAVTRIVNLQIAKSGAYSEKATLGRPVSGVIEDVRSSHAVIKTDDGDLGLVEGKFTAGQQINGTIAWIDVSQQMIHVAANFGQTTETAVKSASFEPKYSKLHGKVVFVNKDVAVFQLRGRGKGRLAYMPRKRHLNDFTNVECPFSVGDELLICVTVKDSKHLLAMDNRVVALQEKLRMKKSQQKLQESIVSLKRKLETEKLERNEKRRKESESDDLEVIGAKLAGERNMPDREIKQEIDDDNMNYSATYDSVPFLEYDNIDVKSEDEDEEVASRFKVQNKEKILLSSSSDSEEEEEEDREGGDVEKSGGKNSNAFEVGFKWEVLNNKSLLSGAILNKDSDSSTDDEEEETKNEKKKRRKLTESEKLEQSKTEEQRLRLIEERLMDPDREPETVDDFDRAVLANPDSSAIWLKYMAFHIQNTEIEEARTVARRALKAISFREEQEKLNIWIALLNLENLYGSEESLGKILSEALQYNEPYKIHLHMLNLYGKSNKLQDMEKLGNFMLKKYKDVENMWIDVGTAYFVVGKIESARLVLQRALTIVNKKQNIMLVSKFAQLENKYGSPERAQTLYESILGSYPKRVDIWSCYVDMLVKSKQIDLARQVLERATSQSLRPRKMKILFKKFLTFEESHGSPENVEKVREAAVEYVQTVGSLNDA